ncbi:hypothetical protein MNEG_3105 [Monoraphidium neglectum]|uniref:Methyltransferase small domain-containing protein n=1 Tax=Monoraphidium neglectum TaxID=145388 RepID=A0A0D2K2U8_9CHLO|nr:hypothetical protein MNEG_3105 [Monoraphidium neglectum]KIZ04858.1 hypothetical protein MNEG_3105 [Monoraphidium neglectum]|eukprot:XP_013903877.1 hypothetical protein MNEG_3105 [Monoraphidium neglectum]
MRVSSSVHQPAGARHVRAPPRRAAPPPPRAGSNGNGASGPAPSPHPAQLLSYLGGAPAATLEPQANGKARPAKGDEAAAQQQAPAGGASKTTLLPVYAPDEVFVCPEESSCYSQALEKLVFGRPDAPETVVEFGAGDGAPVISALLKTPYDGACTAFELNASAAQVARSRAQQFGLGSRYEVRTGCFFEGAASHLEALSPEDDSSCLISNPPYLPARDPEGLLMPALYGGRDGAELTRQLLSLGFPRAMMLVSAYSNPVSVLRHAAKEGYGVYDFSAWPLPFGTYSSQPEVRQWISEMKRRGEAFYSERSGMYLIAGVLFRKRSSDDDWPDLSADVLRVLTAL